MSVLVRNDTLARGWKRYFIMHKDRRVATIREDGSCTVYYPSFLPYNLYLEKAEEGDMDTRLMNLTNFYYWCASRVLTLDRAYAKEILNSIGAKQATSDRERAQIALSYHALSLTDVYWVREDRKEVSFAELSLYNHSLSGAFADVSLCGKQLTAQNTELLTPADAAGDVGTMGVAPKAWIRDKDSFLLLKDGAERDVRAELLASRIADCFRIEHVRYEEGRFEGSLVSQSRIITSEERSIVSAEYINVYCVNHDTELLSFVLKKDPYNYYMMNILDYLVGNVDRHWGNWGFWADNLTNKLTTLHPLMDFNKSFLSYDTVEGARCQTAEGNVSQREAAIAAVREIRLNQIAPVDPAWFESDSEREMFFLRLETLKAVEKEHNT